MASTSILLANPKAEKSSIVCQLRDGREVKIKVPTGISIKTKHWSKTNSNVLSADPDAVAKNKTIKNLKRRVLEVYLEAKQKGILINEGKEKNAKNTAYIKEQLKPKDDPQKVVNSFTVYGRNNFLPNYEGSKRSIDKYSNIISKVEGYEKWRRKKLLIEDIDLAFKKDFTRYLREVERLGENTIGRTFGFVKTILREAKAEGLNVSPQLDKLEGTKKKVSIVYLTQEEIDKIEQKDFRKTPYLENARDWLIVGLYTGQRVSDFLNFTEETINDGFLEFTQKKTGKNTCVPLHPSIKKILEKNNGSFPRKISEQRFNEYIKTVCQEVGLNQMIEGGKINPETNRKEYGKFEKWELVTSHICRRSFATNHYGKLPTPVIMAITNHSTERQFLDYIGKQQKDHAETLKDYWQKMAEAQKKAPMTVLKTGSDD